MTRPNRLTGDVIVDGHLSATSMTVPANAVSDASVHPTAAIARSKLAQKTLAEFLLPWKGWVKHDDASAFLPTTPLTDDLGLIAGTFGSASPSIQTEDLKAAGATSSYARQQFQLPENYDDGETVKLRFHAGMLTTVADTSAVIDVQVFKSDEAAGVGSDLVTDAAQSINSLTLADIDFTVDASGLAAGDVLDIRVTVTVTDGATGTAVKAIIGKAVVLADVRG